MIPLFFAAFVDTVDVPVGYEIIHVHVLLIAVTALATFIFFLPRPAIGTGTEGMKEVFAYQLDSQTFHR